MTTAKETGDRQEREVENLYKNNSPRANKNTSTIQVLLPVYNTSLNQRFLDRRRTDMGFVIAMHGSGICVQRQITLGIQKGLNCVQWPWCKREEIVFPTKPAEI